MSSEELADILSHSLGGEDKEKCRSAAYKSDNESLVDRLFYRPMVKGKDGHTFTLYKLRTMRHSTDDEKRELLKNLGPQGKIKDDPRITPLGRFMKKHFIDEIPQFYNWIRGEMDLVGPRPLHSCYEELFPEDFLAERQRYRPGIGNAVLVYGNIDTPEQRMAAERRYLADRKANPAATQFRCFARIVYGIMTGAIRGV